MSLQPVVPKSVLSKLSVSNLSNIAVLIDADNASAKNIGCILAEIEKLGSVSCKKIYGDWGNAHIQSWQEALLKFAIEPVQQFAYVKGKNATDMAMTIGAMDLLHSGDYDGFCLVSSDSDFTSLAIRIRKSNVKVFGFGKRSTVNAFTQACDRFFYVEDLVSNKLSTSDLSQKNNSTPKITEIVKPKINSKSKVGLVKSSTVTNKNIINEKWSSSRLANNKELITVLRDAVIDHPQADKKQWVNFGAVSQTIQQNYPSFNAKAYGYKRVSDLIRQIDLFETKTEKSSLYVRDKKASRCLTQPVKNSNDSALPNPIGLPHKAATVGGDQLVSMLNAKDFGLLPFGQTSIFIRTMEEVYIVAVRLNDKGNPEGNEDFISSNLENYKHNHVIVKRNVDQGIAKYSFYLNLATQPRTVQHLVFLAFSKNNYAGIRCAIEIQIKPIASIKVLLESYNMTFENHNGFSISALTRKEEGWLYCTLNQKKSSNILKQYGIEISDD